MSEYEKMVQELIVISSELSVAKSKKMSFLHRISRPSITKEEFLRTVSCEVNILDTVESLEFRCSEILDSIKNKYPEK